MPRHDARDAKDARDARNVKDDQDCRDVVAVSTSSPSWMNLNRILFEMPGTLGILFQVNATDARVNRNDKII